MQLSTSKIAGHRFANSNGLIVKAESEQSVLARAGVNVGYQFASRPANLYLKLDWLKEFDANVDFTLNGSLEHINMRGDWFEFGVGAQMAVTEQQKVFFEAKGSSNHQFREKKLNIGYRWNF